MLPSPSSSPSYSCGCLFFLCSRIPFIESSSSSLVLRSPHLPPHYCFNLHQTIRHHHLRFTQLTSQQRRSYPQSYPAPSAPTLPASPPPPAPQPSSAPTRPSQASPAEASASPHPSLPQAPVTSPPSPATSAVPAVSAPRTPSARRLRFVWALALRRPRPRVRALLVVVRGRRVRRRSRRGGGVVDCIGLVGGGRSVLRGTGGGVEVGRGASVSV